MRKPSLRRDFKEDDGSYDFDGFEDAMGDYEDAERDRELEECMERTDERERMADHSDSRERKDTKGEEDD